MIETECLSSLDQLQWYREQQQITIQELAKLSGVPEELIEVYETNMYWDATFDTVQKVVRALGLKFIFVESDK